MKTIKTCSLYRPRKPKNLYQIYSVYPTSKSASNRIPRNSVRPVTLSFPWQYLIWSQNKCFFKSQTQRNKVPKKERKRTNYKFFLARSRFPGNSAHNNGGSVHLLSGYSHLLYSTNNFYCTK